MELLGIDIGGSGIKGAIVNIETGELVTERHRIPTPEGAKPSDVADEVAELVEHFNWKGKVGCGFPALVTHGIAHTSVNIHKSWRGVNVEELFERRTGLKFHVANDADAAGLATMTFGSGKGKSGLVFMITLGTGIGSGAFYNGELIPNFELGSIPYKKYKRIEYYAANSARKRYHLSYTEWGKRVHKFLRLIEKLFSPDYIIIGGGASKKFDEFKDQININTPVIPATYQNNAGILGAALLAK
ncbi:polyphosphate--glucose phosphotransferase [Winogradskyella poriferorum]|uniref:polyphosphate--glucose phosphotransferase n=1 Tax=Winogradskyella poriferorum TaxID=307627 RepID=UPI003D64E631